MQSQSFLTSTSSLQSETMKYLPRLLAVTLLLPLLQTGASPSPSRRNSKRMSIFDAIPDGQFRSGRTIERARSGRQIQPLTCVSKTGSETGVCMFAWNCVEAGGKHLGTCIDRSGGQPHISYLIIFLLQILFRKLL